MFVWPRTRDQSYAVGPTWRGGTSARYVLNRGCHGEVQCVGHSVWGAPALGMPHAGHSPDVKRVPQRAFSRNCAKYSFFLLPTLLLCETALRFGELWPDSDVQDVMRRP